MIDKETQREIDKQIDDAEVPVGGCIVWFGDPNAIPANYIKSGLAYLRSDYPAIYDMLRDARIFYDNDTGFTFNAPVALTWGIWIMRVK
jgi:hypothetical protein